MLRIITAQHCSATGLDRSKIQNAQPHGKAGGSVSACDGLLYGCQRAGSAADAVLNCACGFRWNGIGSSFSNPTGVAIDAAGNVYVADQNTNKLYKETLSNGTYTQSIISSGFQRAYSVAVDTNGNVFVTDANAGSVYKETPSGGSYTQTLLANDGAFGVAVDGSNNVYTVTLSITVNKYTPTGGGNYSATPGLVHGTCGGYTTGVAVDGGGAIYIACDGNSPFYVLKETPAGGGTYTQTTVGTGLSNPTGVAVDTSGNVYIADCGNNRVLLETLSGGTYAQSTVFSGSCVEGVALDALGQLYLADTSGSLVLKQTAGSVNFGGVNLGSNSGGVPLTFKFDSGGTLGSTTFLTQGINGLDFQDAGGGTCNGGTVYSAGDTCSMYPYFNPRAAGSRYGAATLKNGSGVDIATGYLVGSGLSPQAAFSPGTLSTVPVSTLSGTNGPIGVAVDVKGNLYVSVWFPQAVVKETLSGSTYTQTSVGGAVWSRPGGGIAVDGAGNLYVADTNAGVVRVPTSDLTCSTPSNCISIGTGLNSARGMAIDSAGNVYIADTGNNRVLKETLSGGSYTQTIIDSGVSSPNAVAVDSNGNVYVGDTGNNRLLKETPVGASYTQTVVATGLTGIYGIGIDSNDNIFFSTGTQVLEEKPSGGTYIQSVVASSINTPYTVAVDSVGNVYIASDRQVQKLNLSTPPTLNFATTVVGAVSSDSPKTVTLSNIGNLALTLPVPASGFNPSTASGFTLNSAGGTVCPLLSGFAGVAGTLAANASCTLPVSFAPVAAGNVSGSLIITDNSRNQQFTTQSVPLTGVSTAGSASRLAFGTAPPQFLSGGGNAGTVKVNVQDAGDDVITSSSAPITLTVTGPSGYSQTYGPTNASSGVVNFNVAGAVLTAGGAYTYTATSNPLASAVASETVLSSVPVGTASGTMTIAVSITQNFTLGSISVVTQGSAGLDYAFVSGGTCTVSQAYTIGQSCTVNYTFTPGAPGPRHGAVLLSDSLSVVQSFAYLNDIGTGALAVLYPGTQSAVGGALSGPWASALDAAGNLYIADSSHNRVLKVPPTDLACSTAGDCTTVGSGLNQPNGIAVDGSGNVYISDGQNGRVLKETPSGSGYTQTVAVSGLISLYGIAVDGAGNLYISVYGNASRVVIAKLQTDGTYTQGTVFNGFNYESGLTVDSLGNIYIPDCNHNVVYVETLHADGSYTQSSISGGFNCPVATALDAYGDIYVTSQNNNRILRETPAGGGTYTESIILTTDQITGTNLNTPTGLSIDGSGNLYISDRNNNKLIKLTVGGTQALVFPSTYVGYSLSKTLNLFNIGNAVLSFPVPGSGTNPSLTSTPAGISFDNLTTCPRLTTVSSAATLATGATCNFVVDFIPPSAATFTGSIVLTDNSTSPTQTVTLSGVSTTQVANHLAYGVPPPATANPVGAGGNAGTVTVNVESADNAIVVLSSAGVTLTVTGPAGYSQVYGPTAAVSGVATFNLSNVLLTTVGTYTYTATSSPLTSAVLTETLPPTEPVGTTSPTLTATVNFTSSFTLASINVVTQGVSGLDFNFVAGGTCVTSQAYVSGQSCTVNYTFTPAVPGTRSGAIVFTDSTPTVQATVYLTGVGTGALAALFPATQTTIGSGWGNAAGIAVDAGGNVYIVDQSNNRVVKETPAGGGAYTQTVVADSGAAGISAPTDVAVDGAGNVYITDQGNGRIVKESLTGGVYSQSVVDAQGPYALTVDGSGNIYFPSGDHVVKETLSGGTYSATNIGTGLNIGYGSVKLDGAGNLYIGNQYQTQVVKETLSGGSYTQSVIAPSTNGFFWPVGIAVDAAGDVFIADTGTDKLYVERPTGSTYTQSILATNLNGAIFMAIDGSGNLYISNNGAEQFVKLSVATSSLTYPTITGVGLTDSADGPRAATLWNIGNAALSFPVPGSGQNPVLSAGFVFDATNTCPIIASGAGSPGSLATASFCTAAIDFVPTVGGTNTGSLVFTDTSTVPTQTVSLSGVGHALTSQTITFPTIPSNVTYGYASPVTLTATASSGLNVTYTVTGPASLSGSVLTYTGAGTVVITANQSGDSTYAAAAPVSQTITVANLASSGGQTVGAPGSLQTLIFSATSTVNLSSLSIVMSGNLATAFTIVTTGPTVGTCVAGSTSLSAGQSCTVVVRFTPIVPGLTAGQVLLKDSGSTIGTFNLEGLLYR